MFDNKEPGQGRKTLCDNGFLSPLAGLGQKPVSRQSSMRRGAPKRMKIGFADAAMVKQWCNQPRRVAIFGAETTY